MPLAVGVYVRVSKEEGAERHSTARQERSCRAFAELREWPVAEVFADEDISAYRRSARRPAFERLLAAIAARRLDGVLVWKLDRLVRRPAEFETFWAACEANQVVLASVTEPLDTTSELGLALVRILVTFAGLESANKSLRLRARQAELAARGEPHRAFRVFGYTKDFSAEVSEEAEQIREAAQSLLEGRSLRSLCSDWNARGLRTPRGRLWDHSALRQILLARRLTSEREYHGVVVARGSWPAILDDDTAARVRFLLTDPNRRGRSPKRYLLGGLLRCGNCAGPMYGIPRYGPNKPVYRCAPQPYGCTRMSVAVGRADDTVVAAVQAHLASSYRVRAMPGEKFSRDATIDLRRLAADHYVHHAISADEFRHARAKLLVRHEAGVRRQQPDLAALPAGVSVREILNGWDDLELQMQRAVVRSQVAEVIVNRSPEPTKFRPDRLVVQLWADVVESDGP